MTLSGADSCVCVGAQLTGDKIGSHSYIQTAAKLNGSTVTAISGCRTTRDLFENEWEMLHFHYAMVSFLLTNNAQSNPELFVLVEANTQLKPLATRLEIECMHTCMII